MKKNRRRISLGFDRILSHNPLQQMLILVGVLAVVFILSFALLTLFGGGWEDYCAEHHISKWAFPLYLLIDGNAYNGFYASSIVSKGAVFASSIIYVAGAVIFTGMLISVMTNMIERRVEEHQKGHLHYLKSGHYVIMGYDEMVPSFVRHIFAKDEQAFVLLLTSVEAEVVKEKLQKSFNEQLMKRIIINYGHRTSVDAYKDIHLEEAEEVFIVGYHSQPAHDAVNVECVDSICRYLSQPDVNTRPSRITCVFRDLDTYAAFKTSEIFKDVSKLGMEFVPYNFFTGWAKQVFVKRSYIDVDASGKEYVYPAVFGQGITPDDKKFVHLVFVGTTNFAVAFAMEAAHVLHFPNFNRDRELRTRITFIDLNADKEKDEFIIRNRHFFEVQSYSYKDLSDRPVPKEKWPKGLPAYFKDEEADFLDVKFEFIKGDVFSQQVQDEISRWASDTDGQYLSIFLAQANQRTNFVMGMNMPDEVYANNVPIFIRQDRSDNFVTNLREVDRAKSFTYFNAITANSGTARQARYANIYPFGMNETAFCADEKSLVRAKLINYLYATANYETRKFKGIAALNAMTKEELKLQANEKWKELTVALKWSNLYNAYAMRTKLMTLRAMRGLELDDLSHDYDTLTEEEVEEMARVEHNRWNVEKLLMGFRKARPDEDKYIHGEDYAENKKLYIHHDIRPFDELDVIQELDREFSRYLPWIIQISEQYKS